MAESTGENFRPQGEPEKLTPEVCVFSGCNVTNGKAPKGWLKQGKRVNKNEEWKKGPWMFR